MVHLVQNTWVHPTALPGVRKWLERIRFEEKWGGVLLLLVDTTKPTQPFAIFWSRMVHLVLRTWGLAWSTRMGWHPRGRSMAEVRNVVKRYICPNTLNVMPVAPMPKTH